MGTTVPYRTQTYLAKCLILGAKKVGKTTFRKKISRHSEGFEFIRQMSQHITVGFGSNSYYVKGSTITMQFWEIGIDNQTMPKSSELYMDNSNVAFILCDATNPSSIDLIPYLITDFWAYNGHGIQPVMILMNKADLLPQWNQIRTLASFNYRDWIEFIPESHAEHLIELCENVESVLNKIGLNLGFTLCSALENYALTTSIRFLLKELLLSIEYRKQGIRGSGETLE